MSHIALDAADAVELIEILHYFIETLDRVTEHDAIAHVIDDLDPYRISDLQADIVRLTNQLQRSQLTP
jgi:hypothetical protein